VDIKALMVGDGEYLFVLTRTFSDLDGLGYDRQAILAMHRTPDGWSAPTELRLGRAVSGAFDVAYDASSGEFLVFFRSMEREAFGTFPGIYYARGPLDDLEGRGLVVMSMPYVYEVAFADVSAVPGPGGRVDLFYSFDEELPADRYHLSMFGYDGRAWSGYTDMGVGEHPAAIRGGDGELRLYSSQYSSATWVHYSVDEWSEQGGCWTRRSLTTGPRECVVSPAVVDDQFGRRYLVYDYTLPVANATSSLLLQTRPQGGAWGEYTTIVEGAPGYYRGVWVDHPRLEDPTVTIHGDAFNVYYVCRGDVYSVEGRFR